MAIIPRITNSQPLPHLACLIIIPNPFNQLALLIVDNTASFIWFIALVGFSCLRSWARFVVLPTLTYSFEFLSLNIELIWIKASTIHFLVTIINLAHRSNNKLIWLWFFLVQALQDQGEFRRGCTFRYDKDEACGGICQEGDYNLHLFEKLNYSAQTKTSIQMRMPA